jgi:hypothetical protein
MTRSEKWISAMARVEVFEPSVTVTPGLTRTAEAVQS